MPNRSIRSERQRCATFSTFQREFNPPAAVIALEQNYRSTQAVLAAANAVIGQAAERFTKNLWSDGVSGELPQLIAVRDETDQSRYVVERVLDARERGSLLKQQAVLFRASHHSGPLEIELVRRNVPFVKFGGLKFLDAAHIKDILTLLRFVENPRDQIAGFSLMQILPGVGPASAELVLNGMAAAPDPFLALAEAPSPPRASEDWPSFVTTILDLAAGKSGWPSEFQRAQLWYEPHADRIYEDAACSTCRPYSAWSDCRHFSIT